MDAIAIEEARLDTLLSALGLSARDLNALERMSVRTVQDLLRFPLIPGESDARRRHPDPERPDESVPSDAQESRPLVDGKPVPVFTAAQWARIPSAWLAGRRPADDAAGATP